MVVVKIRTSVAGPALRSINSKTLFITGCTTTSPNSNHLGGTAPPCFPKVNRNRWGSPMSLLIRHCARKSW